jgi:cytochrome c556
MSALAAAAETAAARRDAAGLAKAANDLSDTCTACHSVYKTQS